MSSRGASARPAAGGAARGELERRWTVALYAVGERTAHEVKNALNGVAVNIEVVRARANRRREADVSRFADTAATQLEGATRLVQALLALVRPAPDSPDLAVVASPLATLLDASARVDGGEVRLVHDQSTSARTSLGGEHTRLLLAELLLAAQETGESLSCEVLEGTPPTVRLWRSRPLPEIPPHLLQLAHEAAVRLTSEDDRWIVVFPSAVA